MRDVKIFFTQDGTNISFMSSATTFGELSSQVESEHNKSFEGKTVKERSTRAVLSDPQATLPGGDDELVLYVHPNESKAG